MLEDANPYLQVFHHFCELGEYESAFYVLRSGTNEIDDFLSLCGYYTKQVELYTRLVSRWQLEQTQQLEYTASLTSLGIAYKLLGNYQRAISFYQQSLEIQRAIGDKKCEASSLCNFGNAYNCLGKYQQAVSFCQKSLEIQQEIGDKQGESNSFMNLGEAYCHIWKFKEGFVALNRANKLLQQLQLPLKPASYTVWLGLIIRFAQRGKWQIALCFCIGLFVFPLFLAYLVALLLWRFLRSLIKR